MAWAGLAWTALEWEPSMAQHSDDALSSSAFLLVLLQVQPCSWHGELQGPLLTSSWQGFALEASREG